MPVLFPPEKPSIRLLPFPLAIQPSKNYVFNMLANWLDAAKPARGLDAGAGELRNRWMFPGEYVAITHNRAAYLKGLARNDKAPIRRAGAPQVYLMRLESDFSFLGPMDVCVCTYTMSFIEDRPDLAGRLAERVRLGGSMFIQDGIESLDGVVAALEPHFQHLEVVFSASPGLDQPVERADVVRLTSAEMSAPNAAQSHTGYFILARDKKLPDGAPCPAPEIVDDNGLMVVTRDQPYMKV